MKPKNFPGRKNERRVKACLSAPGKINKEAAEIEAANLSKKILPQASAEAIRTKKDRSGSGRIAR